MNVVGRAGVLAVAVAVAAAAWAPVPGQADPAPPGWGWGYNTSGQLGIGTTTSAALPTPLAGPMTDVIAESAGVSHALAASEDGTVWAWGSNLSGELGVVPGPSRTQPAPVAGVPAARAVTAGLSSSYAVGTDGSLWAWGRNDDGELGIGTTTSTSTPTLVAGVNDVTMVAAGFGFAVAVTGSGSVWTWGYGANGALGTGTTTDTTTPVQLASFGVVTRVAAHGDHVVALTSTGAVYAWGGGASGQIGDGTNVNRLVPTLITTLGPATTIGAGQYHSFAVDTAGRLWAWGRNTAGQLGIGTTVSVNRPTLVALAGVAQVDAGWNVSAATLSDGTVWTWGSNASGALGTGTGTSSSTPVAVPGLTGVAAVAAGDRFVLARPRILRPPSWVVAPASVDLGLIRAGSEASTAVTVDNVGEGTGVIDAVTALGDPAIAVTGPAAATSVDPGSSLTFAVVARPTQVGAFSGQVDVVSGGVVVGSVTVTGRADLPAWDVSPAAVAFGATTVAATPVLRSVTVANTGPFPVSIGALRLAGPVDFAIAGTTCAKTLDVLASCTIDLTFAATTLGNRSATLTVPVEGAATTVALSGAGQNAADLVTTVTAPVSATAGSTVVTTSSIRNLGPKGAKGVVATISLSATGRIIAASGASFTCTIATDAASATCTRLGISAGKAGKITVKAAYAADPAASLTMSATATGTVDPTPGDATATAVIAVS